MIETYGWVGSILLALCAIPETIIAIRTGTCKLSWVFLLMWFFGEIFVLIPVISTLNSPYLTFNYGTNACLILIMICYKAFGKQGD